jgi:hypothetical protein
MLNELAFGFDQNASLQTRLSWTEDSLVSTLVIQHEGDVGWAPDLSKALVGEARPK